MTDLPINWHRDSNGRFLRADGCEVTLSRDRQREIYWTAMVPYPSRHSTWVALMDNDIKEPTKFKNPEEAIKAIEDYMAIYVQFTAENSSDSIDLSMGSLGVSGGGAIV